MGVLPFDTVSSSAIAEAAFLYLMTSQTTLRSLKLAFTLLVLAKMSPSLFLLNEYAIFSLYSYELASPRRFYSRCRVHDALCGKRELAESVSKHVSRYLHLLELLPVVDFEHRADP